MKQLIGTSERRASGIVVVAVIAVTVVAVAIVGCVDPFASEVERLGGNPTAAGALTVSVQTPLRSRTVAPDLSSAIASYTVRLSREGYEEIVSEGISGGSHTVGDLEPGEWNLMVEGVNGTDAIVVARSESVSVTIEADETVTETVALIPVEGEDGTLEFEVSWPSDTVNSATATLTAVSGGSESLSITPEDTGLSYTGSHGSGTYELIVLLETGGAFPTAIVEVVYIWVGLTSSASYALDAGDFSTPPATPSGLSAAATTDGIRLSWTDASATETSFVLYRSDDGGSSFSLITDSIAAGTTESIDTGGVDHDNYVYRLYARNSFGDSSYAQATYSGALESGYSRIVGSLIAPSGAPTTAISGADVYVVGQEAAAVTANVDGTFILDIQNRAIGSIIASGAEATYEYQLLSVSQDGAYGIKQDGIAVTDRQSTQLSGPLEVKPTGSISGRFTLDDLTDHAGITVYIPGTSYIAVTNAAGDFTISGVPEGIYNYVRADEDSYVSARIPDVAVVADTETVLDPAAMAVSLGDDGAISINDGEEIATSHTVHVTVDAPTNAIRMKVSETDNFVGINYQKISSDLSYTFDTDGTKYIYIQFEDQDATEYIASDSIIVDTSPGVEPTYPEFYSTMESPYKTDDSTPTVTWSAAPALTGGVGYAVQVSTDIDFGSGTVVREVAPASSISETQWTVAPALPEGTYYYRVAVVQAPGTAEEYVWDWSTVSPDSYLYGVFSVDIAKAARLTVTPTPVTSDMTPTFSWQWEDQDYDLQPAPIYTAELQVALSTDTEYASPVIDLTGPGHRISGTEYTLADPLPDAEYIWRAQSVDPNGILGGWSDGVSF